MISRTHVALVAVGLGLALATPTACGDADTHANASPKHFTATSSGAGGAAGAGGATSSTAIHTDSTTSGPGALCDGTCNHGKHGEGTGDPFSLDGHESSGVTVGDDGSISAVTHDAPKGKDLIWIASSAGGWVSKFDTNTYQELARVGTGEDPSRTSVDAQGDVYVANRAGMSVVKVSASGKDCPDTNGDGKVTTSAGTDLLALGDDDCLLWTRPLGHVMRGAAAQARPAGPDGVMRSDVWVGTLDGLVWRLDGDTGQILATVTSPCPVYGLAIDGVGQLWMTDTAGCVGRIDTTRCVDDASCEALPICASTCDEGGACDASCDTAGRQSIQMPRGGYGITVDFKGRVWLGGMGVQSYDPHALAAKRYRYVDGNFVHGIAADGAGFVWGAAVPDVVRIDGDSLAQTTIKTPSSKGMAVDRAGKIWAISYTLPFATVIVPGATIDDNKVIENAVTSLSGPYTYSDMTGLQGALATGALGRYVERFTGCDGDDTRWIELAWKADVPSGSLLRFRARTAETTPALATATWVDVATVPTGTSPASLAGPLAAAKIASGHFVEIEVTFNVPASAKSPKLQALDVGYLCGKAPAPK
jgi:hypothetical protein